uniref:LRRCT domain-containing protein n=1 Tax=Gopherus agassizii TaxID=38772 RepID=A0A452HCA6_9SAUR
MGNGSRGEMMGPFLCLWIATFFAVSQGCPEPCTCVEKKYGRQLAECAYRGLQAVPTGLPSNVTTLTLSANKITSLQQSSFLDVTQLQIYNNPLNCTCRLLWLKTWAENTLISIPKRDSISCAAPESLRGIPLGKIPKLQCTPPSVQLTYHPNLANTMLYDGVMLMLVLSLIAALRLHILRCSLWIVPGAGVAGAVHTTRW